MNDTTPSFEGSHSPEELLSQDHRELDRILSELLAALDQADGVAVLTPLDLFWARLAMHIRAENLHLFPAIQHAVQGQTSDRVSEVNQAIAKLRDDHDFFMHELAKAMKIMREQLQTRGTKEVANVQKIIAKVSDRLGAHNTVEEKLVYLLPRKLLTSAEQAALAEAIRQELENLPPRFSQPNTDLE